MVKQLKVNTALLSFKTKSSLSKRKTISRWKVTFRLIQHYRRHHSVTDFCFFFSLDSCLFSKNGINTVINCWELTMIIHIHQIWKTKYHQIQHRKKRYLLEKTLLMPHVTQYFYLPKLRLQICPSSEKINFYFTFDKTF